MITKDAFQLPHGRRALARGALLALSALLAACSAVEPDPEADREPALETDREPAPEDDAVAAAELTSRTFVCGFALPGYGCDNGRRSAFVTATSLTSARAACPAVQPAGYTDFCYVIAYDGGIASDPTECSATAGSWRSGNSCCNYKGTKSCPATRNYVCGYALPGYGCDNGRRSSTVVRADLTAALAACPAAQPAGYTDFCYVLDATGGTTADAVDCAEAAGSWRPGNSCCNFKGTLSCP